MTQFLNSPAEFKVAGNAGVVEGYAAVFGNVDRGGDVIAPGAFQKFSTTRDRKTLVLYQHRPDAPIGKADVSQDAHGLHFRAQLVLDDPVAKRAYEHMKAGLLDGMSIGYDILPNGSQWKGDHRELTALHLLEISAVTFGMNPLAGVETVKCKSLRELEQVLREVPEFQLSSRKAKAAANALWPILAAREVQEDVRDERDPVAKFAESLDHLNSFLKEQ